MTARGQTAKLSGLLCSSGWDVEQDPTDNLKGTFLSKTTRTRSKTRLSRALGIALTPKAAKYMEKRPYAPGQHGRTKRKSDSDYAVRLREKQRLRAQYGIREAQLRKTFQEAKRAEGLTGENLVELLEMRLDALVLRSGFARTMAQARQMVVHRHILVDGQRNDTFSRSRLRTRGHPGGCNRCDHKRRGCLRRRQPAAK